MSRTTDHNALTVLEDGDAIDSEATRIALGRDRDVIDTLLHIGTTTHRHVGNGVVGSPAVGPVLVLDTGSGGTLPGGNRIFYRYAYLDADGLELLSSDATFVDTPAPANEPIAPVIADINDVGGTLPAGDFYYVLSYFGTSSTEETLALHVALATVPVGTATNEVELTLPAIPVGMTGINIYRRGPGETRFRHLDDVTVAGSYIDDGSLTPVDRGLPDLNRTSQGYDVDLTVPALPVGSVGWVLYRSFDDTNWARSRIATIAAPAVIYEDLGADAEPGAPLVNNLVDNPEKIVLTDAQEVDGAMPPANVSAFPGRIDVSFGGPIDPVDGTFVWYCDYPAIEIIGVRAHLGRDSAPVANPVIIEADVALATTPGVEPLWNVPMFDPLDRPTIAVGERFSDLIVPDVTRLEQGDAFVVNVVQDDNAATPGDYDMIVSFTIWIKAEETLSVVW